LRFAICCIISKSYLAHARAALKSFAKFHKNFDVHVLVLDDWKDHFDDSREGFKAYSISDIGFPAEDYNQILRRNSPFQIACIMKSFFAKFLLMKKGIQKLLYTDVDILFFSSVHEVIDRLETSNFVLTPHFLSRSANKTEAQIKFEASANAAGIFNMGFFGISKGLESFEFLDWWWSRVQTICKRDIQNGFFDDQKWIDSVPALFDGVAVARNPGFNVANWNLHERDLREAHGRYLVGSKRLAFFHFSGYRPDQAYRLSSYKNVDVRNSPVLKSLCETYKRELKKNGWDRVSKWNFSLIQEV